MSTFARAFAPKRLARPVRKSHAAFAAGREANPADVVGGHAYADWLAENDMPAAEGIVRGHVERTGKPAIIGNLSDYTPLVKSYADLAEGKPFVTVHGAGATEGVDPREHQWSVMLRLANGGTVHSWRHVADAAGAHDLLTWLHGEGVAHADLERRKLERNAPSVDPHWPPAPQGVQVTSRVRHSRRGAPVRKAAGRPQDFVAVLRQLRGKGQRALHGVAADIARSLGLDPARTRDALHDSPAGAVPSVAQAVFKAPDKDHVRYAAAWYGLLTKTPGLAIFHAGKGGPDSLYKFHAPGSAEETRARLDRAGLPTRVMMPTRGGYDVVIFDQGRRLREKVAAAAKMHGSRVEETVGRGEVLGSHDPADARAKYRAVISKFEQGPRRMSRKGVTMRKGRAPQAETEPHTHSVPWMHDRRDFDRLPHLVLADKLADYDDPREMVVRRHIEHLDSPDRGPQGPFYHTVTSQRWWHPDSRDGDMMPEGISIASLDGEENPNERHLRAYVSFHGRPENQYGATHFRNHYYTAKVTPEEAAALAESFGGDAGPLLTRHQNDPWLFTPGGPHDSEGA